GSPPIKSPHLADVFNPDRQPVPVDYQNRARVLRWHCLAFLRHTWGSNDQALEAGSRRGATPLHGVTFGPAQRQSLDLVTVGTPDAHSYPDGQQLVRRSAGESAAPLALRVWTDLTDA